VQVAGTSTPSTGGRKGGRVEPAVRTPSPSAPRGVCKFFLEGNCRAGQACRWKHERPSAPAAEDHSAEQEAQEEEEEEE
jgi:hypothetical protein